MTRSSDPSEAAASSAGDRLSESASVVFLAVPISEQTTRSALLERGKAQLQSEVQGSDSTKELRARHGLFWTPVSGEPGHDVPQLRGDIHPFVIGEVLVFVLLAAVSGVIGNRADRAVDALIKGLPVRHRARPVETVKREVAINTALLATDAAWPGCLPERARYGILDAETFLEILEEERDSEGGWLFRFYIRTDDDETSAPSARWLYTASVSRAAPEHAALGVDLGRARNRSG